ncbi:MAG: thioredoxin family protein [Desulfobulbus sp.]|nr:thioredoxin family protein [Desulfobulbus sp.]
MKSFYPKTTITTLLLSGYLVLLSALISFADDTKAIPMAPVPGKVTMVDLGAKKCIPCKMMAPIMAELEKEYKDRAAIVFIDVWENPDAARKYGIGIIPTQIFYDASGQEMLRHEGFFEKSAIIAELAKLGVE